MNMNAPMRPVPEAVISASDHKLVPVTVVVPIRNEAANLERCLSRLGRFAEVIVVDSGSTDGSLEIAARFDVTVLQFKWNGRYPKKRNWVLTTYPIANAWVLFLDADEVVDDAFCDEVATAVAGGTCDAFWLNYTNHFLGQALRHGVPQRKLALIRLGAGLYEEVREEAWSSLDMEVHEHPIVAGKTGVITSPIEHNDDRGIARFVERHLEYARWEARRTIALRDDGHGTPLTRRQTFKYRHIGRWWYAAFYFLYAYVVRLGFLDGPAGLQYAFYKAWYFATVRSMIREGRARTLPQEDRH